MSKVKEKAEAWGRRLSGSMNMLAWLYDTAERGDAQDALRNHGAYSLLGLGDYEVRLGYKKGPRIGERYTVTLECRRKTVMQCNGPDLKELAKTMMRTLVDNMAEQARSIWAEDVEQ